MQEQDYIRNSGETSEEILEDEEFYPQNTGIDEDDDDFDPDFL